MRGWVGAQPDVLDTLKFFQQFGIFGHQSCHFLLGFDLDLKSQTYCCTAGFQSSYKRGQTTAHLLLDGVLVSGLERVQERHVDAILRQRLESRKVDSGRQLLVAVVDALSCAVQKSVLSAQFLLLFDVLARLAMLIPS